MEYFSVQSVYHCKIQTHILHKNLWTVWVPWVTYCLVCSAPSHRSSHFCISITVQVVCGQLRGTRDIWIMDEICYRLGCLDRVLRSVAARLIGGISKFGHVSRYMHDVLHWLPAEQRISDRIASLVWHCLAYLALFLSTFVSFVVLPLVQQCYELSNAPLIPIGSSPCPFCLFLH